MPISIFVLPLLFAYILTRKARVSITKKEKWRVEINFTLLGIHFNRLLNKKSAKNKKAMIISVQKANEFTDALCAG